MMFRYLYFIVKMFNYLWMIDQALVFSRVGSNYAVQLQKMSAQDFSALTPPGETNFHVPNWQDGNWTNFRGATSMGSLPVDSAKSKF